MDTMEIVLEVFDDEGTVVDRTVADVTADEVSNVVAHAVAVCNATHNSTDLSQLIAELRDVLEVYCLIDPRE